MKQGDLHTVWERDGDLERIKACFAGLEAAETQKESIKQRLLENLSQITPPPSPDRDRGMKRRLKSVWGRWHWKVLIPVAAAVLLIIAVGQGWPRDFLNKSENVAVNTPGVNDASGSASAGNGNNGKSAGNQARDGSGSTAAVPSQMPANGSAGSAADASGLADNLANGSSQAAQTAPAQTAGGKGSSGSAQDNAASGSEAQTRPAGNTSLANGEGAVSPSLPGTMLPGVSSSLPPKIEYTLDITLIAKNVGQVTQNFSQSAQGYKGSFVVNTDGAGTPVQFVVKVPIENLTDFRGEIGSHGTIVASNLNQNNISGSYYAAQSQLNQRQAEEQNDLKSMSNAETDEEVLTLKKSLQELAGQIKTLSNQIKDWDDNLRYVTVNIQVLISR